eukprot:89120_1
MSGIYGLPILLQSNEVDLIGFVAIAPQGTPKFSKQQYQKVATPTLIMYGERDKTAFKDESLYWMENIPTATSVMVTKGEHAAFVGNPEDFHSEILRFLATECKLGEDENYGFDTDTSGINDIYDDDNYFGGYNGYNYGDDTETDYYEEGYAGNYEEYLANYFDQDTYGNDMDYYDESELYFDNRFGEQSDLQDDTTSDTEYEDTTYRA